MVRIILDYTKSVEENAAMYFEKAKKAKKKLKGALEARAESERKLRKYEKERVKQVAREKAPKEKQEKKWFEKLRWFYSSDGMLVIGGRDATTNEILIKKHTAPGDTVFHTDMAGSPFVVVKSEGEAISQITLEEASVFTGCYSKAWGLGLSTLEVFYVAPEQVTKEARAGEYLKKGSFVISGKTNYLNPREMRLGMGMYEGMIMAGPVSAVKKHCTSYVAIVQGREKASSLAKAIQKKIGGELDDIVRVLPTGGGKIIEAARCQR